MWTLRGATITWPASLRLVEQVADEMSAWMHAL
jgi:hypothetical protein